MSTRLLLAAAVSFCLVALNAPPASALTLQQVQAVLRCQDTLDREGRTLVAKAQSGIERCAEEKLPPVLQDDNGLITPERFAIENNRATLACNRLLTGIATETTKFINAVINACGPVEAIVMAPDPPPVGDPLGLVSVWGASTVEEVAGLVCGESIVAAFFLAEGKVPRGLEILATDPDISPSDLDPRCIF